MKHIPDDTKTINDVYDMALELKRKRLAGSYGKYYGYDNGYQSVCDDIKQDLIISMLWHKIERHHFEMVNAIVDIVF